MSLASTKRCWRCIRRAAGPSDRAGLASLEFALIALPFLLLLLGTMDMGRYLIVEISVRAAAADAIRTMVASGGTLTDAAKAQIAASFPLLDPGSLSFNTPTPTFTLNPTTGVTTASVTASYPFSFLLPVFASSGVTTLSETTTQQYL